MAGAMRRKEANRWAAQPPRAIERTDSFPTPPTTRASPPGERSLAAQRRTSPSEAQAEAERTALGAPLGVKASAEGGCGEPAVRAQHEQGPGAAPVLSDLLGPQPCAQRWALPSGLRPAPKGGLAAGQPKCNGRATSRETPLLERPAHSDSAQRPRCGDVASALGAAPRRERLHRFPKLSDLHGSPSSLFHQTPPPGGGRASGRASQVRPRARSGDGSQRVPRSSPSAAVTASPFFSLASGAAFSTDTASVTASTIRAFGTCVR